MPAEAPRIPTGSTPDDAEVGGLLTIDALDRRTRPYRRFVAIRENIISDLGGMDMLSEVQLQLVTRFSTLALQLEMTEAAALAGQAIDPEAFGRSAGHLRRLAEAIGLERRARTVPDLRDYIAAKQEARS